MTWTKFLTCKISGLLIQWGLNYSPPRCWIISLCCPPFRTLLVRQSFDYKSLSESQKFLAENFWQIFQNFTNKSVLIFLQVIYQQIVFYRSAKKLILCQTGGSIRAQNLINLFMTFNWHSSSYVLYNKVFVFFVTLECFLTLGQVEIQLLV